MAVFLSLRNNVEMYKPFDPILLHPLFHGVSYDTLPSRDARGVGSVPQSPTSSILSDCLIVHR